MLRQGHRREINLPECSVILKSELSSLAGAKQKINIADAEISFLTIEQTRETQISNSDFTMNRMKTTKSRVME